MYHINRVNDSVRRWWIVRWSWVRTHWWGLSWCWSTRVHRWGLVLTAAGTVLCEKFELERITKIHPWYISKVHRILNTVTSLSAILILSEADKNKEFIVLKRKIP